MLFANAILGWVVIPSQSRGWLGHNISRRRQPLSDVRLRESFIRIYIPIYMYITHESNYNIITTNDK